MKQTAFVEFVKNYRKGTYTKATYKSQKKAITGYQVEKITTCVVRLGLDCSKVLKRETGSLPGQDQWIKEYQNFLIKNAKEELKVRLYPTKSPKHKITSYYLVNGEKMSKEEILEKGICCESALKSYNKGDIPCYTIMLDNLIEIGA